MWSEDFNQRRDAPREFGVEYEQGISSRTGAVSSRGTRYWNSGSIPLIGPEVLGDIISTASDIGIVISDTGQVLSVLINPVHRSFGKLEHWEGRGIRDFLTSESITKFDKQLASFFAGDRAPRAMELNHTDDGVWEFPVRYTLHQIGPDGALLMLGRDLRPIAEMQQQLVRAQLALERDYESQREYDTRFRVLMDSTREAVVFVSLATGRVTDLNQAAAALIGVAPGDVQKSPFAPEFESGRKGDLMERLSAAAISDVAKPVEAVTKRSGKRVHIASTIFRAAGERYLLCRLGSAEEPEPAGDELTENLNGLYQDGSDAIVFTDSDGIVRTANDAFLNLVDAAHVTLVRGKPLADYMARGSVDNRVLIDNATRAGRMTMYATKLVSEFGTETQVEISATYLGDREHPALVFVMRDTSRAETLRRPAAGVSEDGMRNVMELVGSATLKDIVSETTDVVERMCIETAVDLTSNNRMAAAEMLGLSRQSLYVKLRKYGLIGRD